LSGSRQPTEMDIEHLFSFLPRLYKDGFKPLKRWMSEKDEKGKNYFPWPSYEHEQGNFY